MENTIFSAGEENLIAFTIEPTHGEMYFDFPINIEELAIHEELDADGALTGFIRGLCESGEWEDYNEIREYLVGFESEYMNPVEAEINSARRSVGGRA